MKVVLKTAIFLAAACMVVAIPSYAQVVTEGNQLTPLTSVQPIVSTGCAQPDPVTVAQPLVCGPRLALFFHRRATAGTVDIAGNIWRTSKDTVIGHVAEDMIILNQLDPLQGRINDCGDIVSYHDPCKVLGHLNRDLAIGPGALIKGMVVPSGDILDNRGHVLGHVPVMVAKDMRFEPIEGTVDLAGNIVDEYGDIVGRVSQYPLTKCAAIFEQQTASLPLPSATVESERTTLIQPAITETKTVTIEKDTSVIKTK